MQPLMSVWLSVSLHCFARRIVPHFFERSTFPQSVLTTKKPAGTTSLLQIVPAAAEALLHLHVTEYVNTCLQDRVLHPKLHRKPERRAGMAVQRAQKARSALSKFFGVKNVQTAYLLYFLFNSRTAFPQALTSPRDGFSLRSQQESLDEVEHPVRLEKEVDKAVWQRSDAADHAMRLLTLKLFSHPRALLSDYGLHTFNGDKVLN